MDVHAIPDEWRQAAHLFFSDIMRRLDGATLPERNAILDFIRANTDRIRPAIEDEWLYDSMSEYLLECVALPAGSFADDESVHSRFEAARELVGWFDWIIARDNYPTAIQRRVDRISAVFKNGDISVRNCIETGFLEHVLETPGNRQYFSRWKDDEILTASYTEALRWSEAHTKPNAPVQRGARES